MMVIGGIEICFNARPFSARSKEILSKADLLKAETLEPESRRAIKGMSETYTEDIGRHTDF